MSNEINMKRKLIFVFILFLFFQSAIAQNNRINHSNTIGWYNNFATFKLNKKFGLHTEYQWRRNNLITDWQQSLLRVGLNYSLTPKVLLRVGYGWIETFPYGDFPINGMGKDFTEHRIFETVQLSHKEGIIDLSHRLMLEQRLIGRYSLASINKEDEFPLLNRMRYMLRFQMPLKGLLIKDRTPYIAFYDEIFIGFGENVTTNVFDQNRISLLLGYRFNNLIRIEGGYINQILQFGRQINGQSIFQYNNGLIVNLNFNFDLTNQPKTKL